MESHMVRCINSHARANRHINRTVKLKTPIDVVATVRLELRISAAKIAEYGFDSAIRCQRNRRLCCNNQSLIGGKHGQRFACCEVA